MVCTTVFKGKENAPTGDDELDELLAEARNLSGKNWLYDNEGIDPLTATTVEKALGITP